MNYAVTSLLAVLALIGGIVGEAYPLDRRFELDTQLLEQKITSAAKVKQSLPGQRPSRKSEARLRRSPPVKESVTPDVGVTLLNIAPAHVPEELAALRALWDKLIPESRIQGTLELGSDNFSLVLDPRSYQVMPASDGGRIIIDANRTIPPLVKKLIQEKDPALRIVSGSPLAGNGFLWQLLQSAGFYSVEPDFTLEFGDDPRLSVRAEYRIERTAESLLRNETVLLYAASGRYAMPPSLWSFLGASGFRVIEPDLPRHDAPVLRNRFIQLSGGSPLQVADTVLAALGMATEAGKSIEFPGWVRQGITLKVRPDRSFSSMGKRFALTVYDGNPATYTLTRLLESEGVTVVLLAQGDDSHAVTEKLFAALNLPARFDSHPLWPLGDTPYTVRMSGFLLRDSEHRTLFFTDREATPLMLDLIARNGYAVTGVLAAAVSEHHDEEKKIR